MKTFIRFTISPRNKIHNYLRLSSTIKLSQDIFICFSMDTSIEILYINELSDNSIYLNMYNLLNSIDDIETINQQSDNIINIDNHIS